MEKVRAAPQLKPEATRSATSRSVPIRELPGSGVATSVTTSDTIHLLTLPVHAAAEGRVAHASQPLPHLHQVQASFGRHDIGAIRTTVCPAPAALEARAYTVGSRIAFGHDPDLRLAAHEAAHVVQQRNGARANELRGTYEQHANRVADAVSRGQSAEALLDSVASGGRGEPVVQLKPLAGHRATIITLRWTGSRDDFLHGVIDGTAAHLHIDAGSLYQNFETPIDQAFYAIARTSPKGRIKLDVDFAYNPDDSNNVTGVSNVSIKLHVEAAPAATATATEATAAAPVKASALPAAVPDDNHPPANETLAQRIARQARQTSRVLAQDVASADREGYARIDFVVESDGNEITPSYLQKLDRHDRPQGAAAIGVDQALADIGPHLDFVAGSPGTKWRYAFEYSRGASGAMKLAFFKRLDIATPATTTPISDKAMMREYGIPDRAEIYSGIFRDGYAEMKDSAVMVATFGAEQIALWIAGGWLLKGLGFVGEAAFPRLAALLRGGAEAEVSSALKALGGGEGEELAALMKKLESGEQLSAAETSRLSELYGEVETGLGQTAARGRNVVFTNAMKSSAEVIAKGRDIDKVDVLVEKFGGKARDWVKYKTFDPASGMEVHWYECKGVGKVGVKFAGELDPF